MNNKDRVVGLLAMAAAFTSVSPAGDVAVNRVLKSGPGYKKKRKSKRRDCSGCRDCIEVLEEAKMEWVP